MLIATADGVSVVEGDVAGATAAAMVMPHAPDNEAVGGAVTEVFACPGDDPDAR